MINSHQLDRRRFLCAAASTGVSLLCGRFAHAATGFAASEAVVQRYVLKEDFQGVVALGRGGRALFKQAVGFADFEARVPVSTDNVFGIASISKMLTSVTVLKLTEQKKLALDRPIAEYLPWYRHDQGSLLTLRHLLSNVSGVPNQYSAALKLDSSVATTPLSTSEAVHRYAEGDLLFTPGERFDYSLSNWIIVLAIVEAVTGLDFATAMRQLTLQPLGLANTSTDRAGKIAFAYSHDMPHVRRSADRPAYVAAAGGYDSTMADLMQAGSRIFDTSFLLPASRQALLQKQFPKDAYALGGSVRDVMIAGRPVRAAWDTGNTSGYRSVLGHRLDGLGTVVVLNNTSMSQGTLDEMSDALLVSFEGK